MQCVETDCLFDMLCSNTSISVSFRHLLQMSPVLGIINKTSNKWLRPKFLVRLLRKVLFFCRDRQTQQADLLHTPQTQISNFYTTFTAKFFSGNDAQIRVFLDP